MANEKRVVPHSESTTAPRTTLEQPFYTSPEWYQRDLDLVFKRRWLFAGHSSQLTNEGDFFTYEIGKECVVITRGKERQVHAFHNSCRHRGSRLCPKASGNARVFMCPNHAWTYGLDGSLKMAPRMADLDKEQHSALPVWVEEWNGAIFIHLQEEKPQPVEYFLQAIDLTRYCLDRTKIVHDRTYTVQANWKLAAETYNECYHCGHTHHALCELVDPLKDLEAGIDASVENDFSLYTSDMREAIIKEGTKTFSMDGEYVCRKPLGNGVDWHEEIAALSWFPQFGVFVYPDHAVTYSWKPISATQMLFRSTWLVHEDAIEGEDFEIAKLIALGDITNEEDKAVCENAQRGIESMGYRPGPLHPLLEAPLRGFNGVYLDYVGHINMRNTQ